MSFKAGLLRTKIGVSKPRRTRQMSKTIKIIISIILAVAAIVTIVISMVTDKTTPYLAISLGCSAACNFMNCSRLQEGYTCNKNSSLEE